MRYVKLLVMYICAVGVAEGNYANDYEQSCEMELAAGAKDAITKYVNEEGDYVSDGKPVTEPVRTVTKEGYHEIHPTERQKVCILEYIKLKAIIEDLTQYYIINWISKSNTLQSCIHMLVDPGANIVYLYRKSFANKKTLVTIIYGGTKLSFAFYYTFQEDGIGKQNSEYTISSLQYTNINHNNVKKFILLLATFLYKLDLVLDPIIQKQILQENGYIVSL